MSEETGTKVVPLEVYCGTCNGDLINLGFKYVHRAKLARDDHHLPNPTSALGRPIVDGQVAE